MFKVHPIRGDCPICKGRFEGEMPSEEKPKKKGEEEAGQIEPHVKKLYEMTFTKRMINQQLVAYIEKESPNELMLQEMLLSEKGVLLNDIAVKF